MPLIFSLILFGKVLTPPGVAGWLKPPLSLFVSSFSKNGIHAVGPPLKSFSISATVFSSFGAHLLGKVLGSAPLAEISYPVIFAEF